MKLYAKHQLVITVVVVSIAASIVTGVVTFNFSKKRETISATQVEAKHEVEEDASQIKLYSGAVVASEERMVPDSADSFLLQTAVRADPVSAQHYPPNL